MWDIDLLLCETSSKSFFVNDNSSSSALTKKIMPAKNDAKEIARTIAHDCVGVRVRMLNRIVSRIYDDRIRHHEIKISQLNILVAVTLRGPIQPSKIGRLLSLEKSTLSRNVKRMEENAWIEFLPGEGGNSYLLRVTRRGQSLLKKVWTDWQAAQQEVETLLSTKEITTVKQMVNRIK